MPQVVNLDFVDDWVLVVVVVFRVGDGVFLDALPDFREELVVRVLDDVVVAEAQRCPSELGVMDVVRRLGVLGDNPGRGVVVDVGAHAVDGVGVGLGVLVAGHYCFCFFAFGGVCPGGVYPPTVGGNPFQFFGNAPPYR